MHNSGTQQAQYITEICCADNALEALPESLGLCTNLVKLQASFNKLRELPASIGALPKLELLRVACNCLEEVLSIFQQRTVHASCRTAASLLKYTYLALSAGEASQSCILVHDEASRLKWGSVYYFQVPEELARCQSLAWTSLAGNPCCAKPSLPRHDIQHIAADALGMGASLGEGASGDVFAADMVSCCPGLVP